jgi:serine/threonine protein kinase
VTLKLCELRRHWQGNASATPPVLPLEALLCPRLNYLDTVQGLKQISRYEILSELGRGAMGVVFKARDPQIGRLIALKTITASVAEDPGLLERFRGEAQAAGALQHPNIVTIYEMGEADGVPFIAMEYLEGESLDALISRRAQVPLAQKVEYLVQTCRALQYAHRRGVIHRDIKPANIVVTVEGTVKVVDFGIARLTGASKTQTGTLLGTLAYMSPQQIRGDRADARSDIWSVGVVLYELLTYRRPFQGENHAALLLSILQNEPVPLRKLLGECPHQLDLISQRTLAKDYSARYQSMEELLLELKSSWAALHLNKPGDAPAEPARAAVRGYARPGGVGPRSMPAQEMAKGNNRSAPSSDLAATLKAPSIPPASVTATVLAPNTPSRGPANSAWATQAKARSKARSWHRGISLTAIGLVVVVGIGLEAIRVIHSRTTTPLSSNASQPSSVAPEAVQAAVKVVELPPAGFEKSTSDAQFNAALAHFRQAVAVKDASSLRLRVRLEFEQIAEGRGPRANEAEGYVSSKIPMALRGMMPWPRIGCGVGAPDREIVQFANFVACGTLDPPKLQWLQFSWPEFPARAREAGLSSGVAMLSLNVDEQGNIIKARSRVKADSFGFADSAIQAALKWKTTLPRAGGSDARTQFSVDVPFSQ